MDRLEMRLAGGRSVCDLDGRPGDGRAALWVRIPESLEMSAAALAILGDFVPFGSGRRWAPAPAATASTTRCGSCTLVPTEWVLLDIRVHAVADGFGHGLVHLWAEDGTLLGHRQPVRHRAVLGGRRRRRHRPSAGGRNRHEPSRASRHDRPVRRRAAARARASGSRSSPTSATPTCGRPRPTAPTPSRRWPWPRRGRRALRLGTAIVPAFTRGAGAASPRAWRRWPTPRRAGSRSASARRRTSSSSAGTASRSSEPYKRVRDMVRFLRAALARREGHRGVRHVRGEGLPARRPCPSEPPPILVAALRPGMLRLAGREGDGAIINWLSADDVTTVGRIVHARGDGQGDRRPHLRAARPTTPTPSASAGKFAIAAYLNVPVYAAFHEWLGRGEALQPMWDAWKAGDRKPPPPRSPTGGRRADRPRLAGAVPRAHGPLRRQRGHHAGARVPRRSRRRAPGDPRGGAERVIVPRRCRCRGVRRLA